MIRATSLLERLGRWEGEAWEAHAWDPGPAGLPDPRPKVHSSLCLPGLAYPLRHKRDKTAQV